MAERLQQRRKHVSEIVQPLGVGVAHFLVQDLRPSRQFIQLLNVSLDTIKLFTQVLLVFGA